MKMKVHEMKAQATLETWPQQPYMTQHSPSSQRGPQGVTFHYMKTVQLNSLNKQEDNKHIRLLWLATHPKAQVNKLDCKVDTGAECNIMPLYIYRSIFEDQRLELDMMMITGYGDTLVTLQDHAQQYSSLGV